MTKAEQNDLFRTTMSPEFGEILVTQGVAGHPALQQLLQRIQEFREFGEGGDPYGEHDFGAVEIDGQTFFWKIEEQNPPIASSRLVMTIMLAEEY